MVLILFWTNDSFWSFWDRAFFRKKTVLWALLLGPVVCPLQKTINKVKLLVMQVTKKTAFNLGFILKTLLATAMTCCLLVWKGSHRHGNKPVRCLWMRACIFKVFKALLKLELTVPWVTLSCFAISVVFIFSRYLICKIFFCMGAKVGNWLKIHLIRHPESSALVGSGDTGSDTKGLEKTLSLFWLERNLSVRFRVRVLIHCRLFPFSRYSPSCSIIRTQHSWTISSTTPWLRAILVTTRLICGRCLHRSMLLEILSFTVLSKWIHGLEV